MTQLMSKKFCRMGEATIKTIISDLNRFSRGELGGKITWALMEDRYGFSRQALQARPEIKAAYLNAKIALSGELIRSQKNASEDVDVLRTEIARMQIELDEYKRMEAKWMERWQRIAYHIRQNGQQVYMVDRGISKNSLPPSERATADILRPFDKEIPSTGRR